MLSTGLTVTVSARRRPADYSPNQTENYLRTGLAWAKLKLHYSAIHVMRFVSMHYFIHQGKCFLDSHGQYDRKLSRELVRVISGGLDDKLERNLRLPAPGLRPEAVHYSSLERGLLALVQCVSGR